MKTGLPRTNPPVEFLGILITRPATHQLGTEFLHSAITRQGSSMIGHDIESIQRSVLMRSDLSFTFAYNVRCAEIKCEACDIERTRKLLPLVGCDPTQPSKCSAQPSLGVIDQGLMKA